MVATKICQQNRGKTMKVNSEGLCLRIYVGSSERYEGQSLAEVIIQRARKDNLAGATVLGGSVGFGSTSQQDKANPDSLAPDTPVIVEIVDVEEKVNRFAAGLDGIVKRGLVTRGAVHLTKYADKT